MGVLDFGGDRRRGRGSCGREFGSPVVTNGELMHSCVEVHALMKLSFGVLRRVGPGIGVLG